MSYFDEAIRHFRQSNPGDYIQEFEYIYRLGKAKILESSRLIRLLSPPEAAIWNRVGPVGPHGASHLNPSMMRLLFVGGGGYTSKWFAFDRPYLFRRQTVNTPGGRDGQGWVMEIPLSHPLKNTLIKKLLPDKHVGGLPKHMKTDSCRCKQEEGVITLGISLPVLEKIAINMKIEKLGGRITP